MSGKDVTIDCRDCAFAVECRADIQAATGDEVVYYRGRFRADAPWARAHRVEVATRPVVVKIGRTRLDEADATCRRITSRVQRVGTALEEVQVPVQQNNARMRLSAKQGRRSLDGLATKVEY